MTYGENSSTLRTNFTTLLQHHRIQQRIGGAGIHTVPATRTAEERDEIGKLLRRYRQSVLTWCHLAVTAANPRIGLAEYTGMLRGPIEDLTHRLGRCLATSDQPLPTMAELSVTQHFELVDIWRQAAVAAAIGEHDFAHGVGRGTLDHRQCMTVLKDAATLTSAVVVLDHRYENIPGWKRLTGGHLGRIAALAADFASYGRNDYTVDNLGRQPAALPVEGAARPGLNGVLQAEHNLHAHLREFPTALNLKRILDSQRELSHLLAQRTTDPGLAAKWSTRARTYTRVFAAARDLGGLIGNASYAAAEGANALSRLQKVPAIHQLSPRTAGLFDVLFDRIDTRVVAILDQGAHERLYFIKPQAQQMETSDGHLVHRPPQQFSPIVSSVQTDLLRTAHEELLPTPCSPKCPPEAARSRLDLEAAIDHRPGDTAIGM